MRSCKGSRALLEGPHLVAEAIAAGVALEEVLMTPDYLASPEGSALAAAGGRAVIEVAPEVLAALADADSPRGALAVAELPRGGAETLPARAGGRYLFADGLQDPGNLGALARVVEAVGGAGLALAPGSVHPNHPRALRASAGSLLRLPVALAGAAELNRHLEALSPRWLALVPRGGVPLAQLGAALGGAESEAPQALIVAVGAEGPGLDRALAGTADLAVTVPLEPPVESLNVTVAAAVVLFELKRLAAATPPL